MNKLMLKLVVLLRPLWEKLGGNMPQLLAILRVKLLMDDRRPNAYTQMRGHKQKKESKNASGIVMFISFLMGCFYLFFFQIGKDPLLHLFIYCCAFMTMLMLTLISDFTYVLIDVKDNLIILPKPVNDRTVLLSRLLHIFIHVSKLLCPWRCRALFSWAIYMGW
ncbi:hypothetical protein MKQ70_18165 [Chitinophaga sedimenti]|uniref:hypothetical protein n=1 Tax=Chitinophaga sedimenti TaxID=2033606 RepID=UPI0020045958|nr:hypothetical protein [Chitinophaga sedimenti]MCK7556838.1 hypothetical protein [Chitinophaga sedimenti]